VEKQELLGWEQVPEDVQVRWSTASREALRRLRGGGNGM